MAKETGLSCSLSNLVDFGLAGIWSGDAGVVQCDVAVFVSLAFEKSSQRTCRY